MKKLLFYFSITSLFLLVFSKTIAQVSYSASFQANAGNPGGLYNLANDAPGTTGWTSCGLAGSLSSNAWSPAVTLPFAFDFYGTPVTQFKVSANGLLTFDATVTGTPPNVNGNLPDASLPNNTICAMWDEFTSAPPLGANDIVYYRVFGTAPNRQLWVYWYSYEIGNPVLSFNYWAAVLEETTNKVYVIDTYGNTTPLLSTTVGVQLDATTATQYGINNIAQAGNGTALTDNDVWTFLPQTPCSGAPVPGNTLSSVATSCGDFTLSLSNSNLGSGVTYQWQISTDGINFVDITGATNATYVTQQSATNYYQCVTTCSIGGASATSVPVMVVAGTYAQCLCIPASTGQASWVSAFNTTSGVSNFSYTSGAGTAGGYNDQFGSFTASNYVGAATNIAMTAGGPTCGFAVWIDWNNNAVFETTERVFNTTGYVTTTNGSFLVPVGTPNGSYRMRVVTDYNSTNPTNPCATITRGEFVDFTFDVVDAPSCLPPTALVTSSLTTTGVTVSWTAPTPLPDNGYQYIVSTTSATPAAGATPTGTVAAGVTSVVLTGLTPNTTYYVFVASVCGSTASSWSNSATFYTGYCVPAPSSVDGTGITNVTFGTINNTTGAEPGNYGDYSAQSNDVPQTTTATVLITYSTGYTYDTKIWVDWNDDLDFNDAGEEVYVGTSLATNPTTLTATFTVPLTAPLGAHRMRIGGQDAGPAVPCYNGSYGTLEDYTINVTPAPTCLSPTALANSAVTTSGATITWTAPSPAPDNGYQYFVSTTAGSPAVGATPTGTVAAGTTSVVVTGLNANTTYYVFVASICGTDVSPWSSSTSFYTGYCVPTTTFGCTDGDVIARVILNTLDNNSGTGCPSGNAGYSDYTEDPTLTTTLLPSTTYNCTVYAGQYSEGYAAWIDYNDDLIFDASERIGYSNGQVAGSGAVGVLGSSATFTVSLACNPPAGTHRLRVRAMYFENGINVTPCADNSYGEVEDYLITIAPAPTCPSPGTLTASNPTINSIDLSWPLGCSSASNYDFEYGPAGFTPGTGTIVNNAAATISGTNGAYTLSALTPNTAYDIYFRANCGGADYSVWSLYSRDTTLCLNTSSSEAATACGSYSWNGQTYSSSGVYTYVTNNQYGCDSTVTLSLTINAIPVINGVSASSICLGDSSLLIANNTDGGQITWYVNGIIVGSGDSIEVSPVATTTFEAISMLNNCFSDTSVVTINVYSPDSSVVNASTCDTAYVWNNVFYTQSGTYTYLTQTINGCDSLVTLNLTLNNAIVSAVADTACNSYTWNGQTYTETGVYTYVGQTVEGCDSTVTLSLVINSGGGSYELVETCVFPYTWPLNGQTYTSPGLYFEYSTNEFGCDVYDSLNLVQLFAPSITATENGGVVTLDQMGTNYQWIDCTSGADINGATSSSYTPTETGTYACFVTFADGCADTSNCVSVEVASLMNLGFNLTIQPNPSNGVFNISISENMESSYSITDSFGRLIVEGEIKGTSGKIDLSKQETGIYYFKINSNNNKVFRIIKN